MVRLLFPLKIEGFQPVLNAMGEGGGTSSETIWWIVLIFVIILIVPVIAYRLRKRMLRRDFLARGFDQLQKISDHNDLSPNEQSAIEQLALAVPRANPSQILSSVDGFDSAVKVRMKVVRRLPWLEMEKEVEKLASIREKMGFRFIPEDRRPQNTRHLMLGQRIYILAKGDPGFRLLSAPVTGLNDLGIFTDVLFTEDDNNVRLKATNKMWAFFWSPAGGECRFGTRLIKAYERPTSYLLFEHSDDLVYNEGRKIFSCDLDQSVSVERVSAESYSRYGRSEEIFEVCEVDSLHAQMIELSASGFVLSTSEPFKLDDRVRLSVSDPDLSFLNGWSARVVTEDGLFARCRFLKKSGESLEKILRYVTPRISKDALKGRSRKKAVSQTS